MTKHKRVLVLNKTLQPVGIIGMQRAMNLLCSCNEGTNIPKARVIDHDPESFMHYDWIEWAELPLPDGEDVIRSAKQSFRAPVVIVLTKFNKLPNHKISFSRKMLWRRDDFQCQYCGTRSNELTIDHIHPKSRGGKTTWENCCLACVKCNMKKADRTPKEAGMKFFFKDFKPLKPKYNFFKNDIMSCEAWQHFLEPEHYNDGQQNLAA